MTGVGREKKTASWDIERVKKAQLASLALYTRLTIISAFQGEMSTDSAQQPIRLTSWETVYSTRV